MLCFGFLIVFSCQQPAPPPATAGATFCQTYQPVYWSSSDTRKTKEQVDTNNRVWKQLCGNSGNGKKK